MRKAGGPPQAFKEWHTLMTTVNARAMIGNLASAGRSDLKARGEACSGELGGLCCCCCCWSGRGRGGDFSELRMCAAYCSHGDVILLQIKILLSICSGFRCTQHLRARFYTFIEYVVCNHNLRSAYFDPESRKIYQNLLVNDLFPSTTGYVSRNKNGHVYLSEFSPRPFRL